MDKTGRNEVGPLTGLSPKVAREAVDLLRGVLQPLSDKWSPLGRTALDAAWLLLSAVRGPDRTAKKLTKRGVVEDFKRDYCVRIRTALGLRWGLKGFQREWKTFGELVRELMDVSDQTGALHASPKAEEAIGNHCAVHYAQALEILAMAEAYKADNDDPQKGE